MPMEEGAYPEAGQSAALCFECGALLVFTSILGKLTLREATPEEREELEQQSEVHMARAVAELAKGRPPVLRVQVPISLN